VEICVAEVGAGPADDQLYRLSYDGTIVDEPEFLVMGGQAEALTGELQRSFTAGLDIAGGLAVAVAALGSVGGTNGAQRSLPASQLEVAVLDRTRGSRKFKRITGLALAEWLPADAGAAAGEPAPADTPPHDEGDEPA
jgi:proteasome alpha subunit